MGPSKYTAAPSRQNTHSFSKAKLIPSPSFRHAAPSAPWPWVDIDDGITEAQRKLMDAGEPPIPDPCDHKTCDNCWIKYPESLYPNWTSSQVEKSKITEAIQRKPGKCVCYRLDIDDRGHFKDVNTVTAELDNEAKTWKKIQETKRPTSSKTRAIFVDQMSGPILQMLGTKYNIEPFFFSSSLNWIPSRFQADLKRGIGDHITITLVFLRSVSSNRLSGPQATMKTDSGSGPVDARSRRPPGSSKNPTWTVLKESIDTKAPLKLKHLNRHLCLDLLSVHMIRNINGSTIISYHPDLDLPTTRAEELHDKIRYAGQSVYWQKMLQESNDPTLVLLIYLWHAMYAWDQALEHLYSHIRELESQVTLEVTEDLHVVRAHQLFYASLLGDFRDRVQFIRKHKNPAMISGGGHNKDLSKTYLERECDNLDLEINRLIKDLRMQQQRLKNVMNMVFSKVNIADSQQLKGLTEAAAKDSAAMKQVAYLTMVFLPATFMAGIFGMNTKEINPDSKGTLPYYVAFALPLTLITIWIIIAFQSRYLLDEKRFFARLGWPYYLLQKWWTRKEEASEEDAKIKPNDSPA